MMDSFETPLDSAGLGKNNVFMMSEELLQNLHGCCIRGYFTLQRIRLLNPCHGLPPSPKFIIFFPVLMSNT